MTASEEDRNAYEEDMAGLEDPDRERDEERDAAYALDDDTRDGRDPDEMDFDDMALEEGAMP